MKCPHCNALFAHPNATETEATVTDEKNKKEENMGVTVFTCPVCEAVFSVHPGDAEANESKSPVEKQPAAASHPLVPKIG